MTSNIPADQVQKGTTRAGRTEEAKAWRLLWETEAVAHVGGSGWKTFETGEQRSEVRPLGPWMVGEENWDYLLKAIDSCDVMFTYV